MEKFVPGYEGARQLARALRQQMPQKFEWYFPNVYLVNSCGTMGCAMGLAKTLWPAELANVRDPRLPEDAFITTHAMADALGMEPDTVRDIFWNQDNNCYPCGNDAVTPQMVAEKIDNWLASKGEPTSTCPPKETI